MNTLTFVCFALAAVVALVLGVVYIADTRGRASGSFSRAGALTIAAILIFLALVLFFACYLLFPQTIWGKGQPRHVTALGGVTLVAMPSERPRLSQAGCAMAADMVLVARALSQEGIERTRTDRIMTSVYASIGETEQGSALRQDLTDYGYGRPEPAVALAQAFLEGCLTKGGAIGTLLGTKV